jgi:hypothetical protein
MNNKQLEDTLREQSKWDKAQLIVRGAIEDDLAGRSSRRRSPPPPARRGRVCVCVRLCTRAAGHWQRAI